jgi:hypothetical protein
MDPEIHLSTMREIRGLGLELTGAYHSHPRTPAVPSVRCGELAAYRESVHLIVSLAALEPEVLCYRIEKRFNTSSWPSGQRRHFIPEEIAVDWPRQEWGVPGLEGAERALRLRRPFEPDPGNAGGGTTMSSNRTCQVLRGPTSQRLFACLLLLRRRIPAQGGRW